MHKKPSNMTSEELWNFIRTGTPAEGWQLKQIKSALDEAYQTEIARKRVTKRFEEVGACTGIFVVLCIYGGFFYFLSKAFYPLTIWQSFLASVTIFLVGKILTIPTIRFWNSKESDGKI